MEDDLVKSFLKHLRAEGKDPLTINEYAASLAQYALHLVGCSPPSLLAATQESATRYATAVKAKQCGPKAVYKKLHSVHAFYEWLQATGYILTNPFTKPCYKPPQTLPSRVAARDDIRRAFRELRCSRRPTDLRDYAIIDLAYTCGLRRCELQRLNVADIDTSQRTIRVRGKRRKERLVPIGEKSLHDLLYYIYHVRPRLVTSSATPALFVSWNAGGKRMVPESINAAFRRQRRTYGFEKTFSPHALRHAFATDLIKNGAAVQDVSRMLGHVKLETTQVYTRLAPVDLKRCHERYHPRG